jgi:hypothetical protein
MSDTKLSDRRELEGERGERSPRSSGSDGSDRYEWSDRSDRSDGPDRKWIDGTDRAYGTDGRGRIDWIDGPNLGRCSTHRRRPYRRSDWCCSRQYWLLGHGEDCRGTVFAYARRSSPAGHLLTLAGVPPPDNKVVPVATLLGVGGFGAVGVSVVGGVVSVRTCSAAGFVAGTTSNSDFFIIVSQGA